jgi:hypothetical protein
MVQINKLRVKAGSSASFSTLKYIYRKALSCWHDAASLQQLYQKIKKKKKTKKMALSL